MSSYGDIYGVAKIYGEGVMVILAGFEPAIFWMRTRYPKPLDDRTKYFPIITDTNLYFISLVQRVQVYL